MIINIYVRGVVSLTSYELQKGHCLLSLGNHLVRSGPNIAVGGVYVYLEQAPCVLPSRFSRTSSSTLRKWWLFLPHRDSTLSYSHAASKSLISVIQHRFTPLG
jgi:hypothetical protein